MAAVAEASEGAGLLQEAEKEYETRLTDEDLGAKWRTFIWRLWVALTCISWLSCLATMLLGTCRNGAPLWILLPFANITGATLGVQLWEFWDGCRTWKAKVSFLVAALLSLADTWDFFTDGQGTAQAFLCDADFHDVFVKSFEDSLFSFLAPAVRMLHMYGMMLAVLVVATVLQGMAVRFLRYNDPNEQAASSSSAVMPAFVGLGGITHVLGANMKNETAREGVRIGLALIRGIATVLVEVIPQVYLQTSLFSLTFASTSGAAKAKQLFSLALGAGALLKAAVSSYQNSKSVWMDRTQAASDRICLVVFILYAVPGVFCMGTLVICALRVHFAFACPDHVWNVSSGCVDMDTE